MLQKPRSKSTTHISFSLTSLLLVLGFLAMPGCQTFKSTFKMPTASKLAFWKKDSGSVPPPPPSRHLNPVLTDEKAEMASQTGNQSAGQTQIDSSGIDIDEYRRKIDEMKDGIASTQNKIDFGKKPLRSPYESGEVAADSTAGTFKSDFKSDFNTDLKEATGNSLDKGFAALEKAKQLGSNSRASAQNQFKDAMAEVKKSVGNNDFRAAANTLSTKPSNEFKQALANTNSQLSSKLESLSTKVQSGGGFDASMAKVNQSLYDMNGKLTTGASSGAKSIGDNVEAARQRFSSALGTVSDRAIEAAKSSTEFGGGIKDKIVAAASELKPPLRGGDNSFKPSFTRAADPVKAEAQSLLSKARERVAGLGTGFDFPESVNSNSQPKTGFGTVPQPTTSAGNLASSAPATNQSQPAQSGQTFGGGSFGGSDSFNQTRVANVTPVNPKRTLGQSNPGSSLTKAWNNGATQSQLKPIEIGARTAAPSNGLRTASLQSNDFGSSVGTIPAAFDQGRNAMTSHVSEIDIPTKILSGNSSYAPGSVNKVR